jgi:two-component system OmpR family sensor kinase
VTSLRGRLLLAVLAVAVVALVAADAVTFSSLRSFLSARTDQSLRQAVASLEPALVGGAGNPVPPGAAGAAGARGAAGGPGGPAGASSQPGPTDAASSTRGAGPGKGLTPPPIVARRAPGYFVELRSPDGTVLTGPYPAYAQGGKSYSPALPGSITGFTAPGPGSPPQTFLTEPSTTAGGPAFRVLAVRQPNGDVLVVGAALGDTTNTLDRLLVIELLVSGAALVAALVLGWWLVRLGLRPLIDVEETAERIAGGHLDERVPGEEKRTEVGRLARTLNAMLTRIQEAFVERDATEAALRRSEERLRRFVADASHELRTPLAAVSAYAELFERGAGDRPDDLARVMAGIRSETGRMGRLVEDLLLLARLDQGRPLERVPVDLADLAAAAVATSVAVGPSWPISLVSSGPVEVVGDPARLRQVLDNLLANIRAHTPAGTEGVVRVSATPEGGGAGRGAVIEVSDTGPGVGPVDRARLFERFYRADPARTRSPGGSGLGLSIVASVVAAHGGEVTASERTGGGTVITVRLPGVPLPEDAGASRAAVGDGGSS